VDAYAVLDQAWTALGRAAAEVVGTGDMKERARGADAGELDDTRTLALAAEVQALAALLASGRMRA
jgi:hypothetical protein